MKRREEKRREYFILNKKPKRYPQQHDFTECGLFTIKAIIEAFYPKYNKNPIQYASSRIHKTIKFSLPKRLCTSLKKYNISHTYGKYNRKEMPGKIDFLKNHLKKGPVIILISHAYTKRNMFNIRKALIAQHYISIWGYNDEEEIFYCYDSHTEIKENDLPIGNIKLHYQDLITYRDFAGIGLFKKRYIAIHE